MTIILVANVVHYFKIQKDNENHKEICDLAIESYTDFVDSTKDINQEFVGVINNPDSCYCRMYTHILPRLLVYKVKNNKK